MKTLRISLLLLGLLATVMVGRAQITAPGWYFVQNQSLTAQEIDTNESLVKANGLIANVLTQPSSPLAEAVTPQIQALADGLQDNPTNIFNYVHDHIKFVVYFGAKKGANLTLLEKSGNDFDQSALLVALLSAAGYSNSVQYQFGWEQIPYDDPTGANYDYHHWWQLTLNNNVWTNTLGFFGSIVGNRGYPSYSIVPGDTNDFLIPRTWVQLTLGGTTYQLDPAFKVSLYKATVISMSTAMGSGTISNDLISAAGGTSTANYTQNIKESAVRGKLAAYTTNFLNYLQSNAPNASLQDVLGGWQIVPATARDFGTSPTFATPTYGGRLPSIATWTYEPTNLMSTLAIKFANTNYQWLIPQLQGQRLSLTFNNNGLAQLWQEDTLLAQGPTSGSGTTNVVMTVTHPIGSWDLANNVYYYNPNNFANHSATATYQCANATYAIMYAFEPDWGWLQQRQNKLDAYLQAGYTNGSRQVVSETLNVMGLNWMLETDQAGQLTALQLGILPQNMHRLGRMAQEAGRGYYVDVYMQLNCEFPSGGNDAVHVQLSNSHFDLWMLFGSSMEHGIIEQLQATNIVGASTVKMLQIANTNGQAVYLASSNNWSSIQSSLINYGSVVLNYVYNTYITQGYYVLMPANGANPVSSISGSWTGYGYEARQAINGSAASSQMIISGSYNGGYSSNPYSVVDTGTTYFDAISQPTYFNSAPVFTSPRLGADPVDMANGTFQVQNTDLALGQIEPRGLSFTRYYNSARRNSNLAGMAPGWLHNYYLNASAISASQVGLGTKTPALAAAMLTATTTAIALYNGGQPDARNWLTTALVTKWGVDQLTAKAVSVSLGESTVQFIQQPDGRYTPPANCTMTLTTNGAAYSLHERHGRTFTFNGAGWATNITDAYNQSLVLTYNASNWVSQVKDWKGRTFTFNYSATTPVRLTNVVDSTGRSIAFGYGSSNDLTSVTDPEGKVSTFLYDTNHQITATLNALSQVVASNIYNSFGRVTTQYTAGDPNKTWHIFWSGWQTVAQDPSGAQQSYFYDDKTRLTGQQDALGDLTQKFYDGQDHVIMSVTPLGETNQFIFDGNHNLLATIDPLGYSNQFFYDANNNLKLALDANQNSTTYGYNANFSLIGQTNGAGDWVSVVYNSDGTLSSRTDAGGTVTNGYDAFGQLNGTGYVNGLGQESFVNSALGDVTNHVDARGFAMGYQYNNRRQLTNTLAPTNLVVKMGLDAVGNVTSTIDARGNVTSNSWSATRQLLATTLPALPAGVPVITNGYDNRDLLVQTTDPLAHSVYYTNDLIGHTISVTDPVRRTLRMNFDANGHRLSCTNAANETTSQGWDARGDVIQQTDGAGHSSQQVYDGAGNLLVLTNRNGNPWHFNYDAANRMISAISPLGYSNVVTYNHQGLPATITDALQQPTSLYYDAKGRITNRTDNVGTTRYALDANDNVTNAVEGSLSNVWAYDAYNRVSSYQDIYGNVISYRYDAAGNITNLIYPGGRVVAYDFDTQNHLTNITDWANRKTSLIYDLAGHVTTITRPNGSYRTMGYDAAGQMTNILEQMSNGLPIAIFRMAWTNTGNMAWEFAAPLPHAASIPTRTMSYDADNRLKTVDTASVVMDNDGNLTSGPLTNDTFATYTFDARNRLQNVGGVTNTYDFSGNRLGLAYGTNRTMLVMNPNAPIPQVLLRIKNGVTNYYIYGAGLMYQISEMATHTNTLTYHYDYRGSTIALSADSGLVTDRMEYSLYGLTTYHVGTNDTPFLFNGRYGVMTDPHGLMNMQARYYSPFLCRFISSDPSGFNGGLNMYAFANGNPINNVDPFGLGALGEGLVDMSWFNAPTPAQAQTQQAVASFVNFATLGVADIGAKAFAGQDIYGSQVPPEEQRAAAINLGSMVAGVAAGYAFGAVANAFAVDATETVGNAVGVEVDSVPMGFKSIQEYQQTWGEMTAADRAQTLQQALPPGSQGRVTMGAGAYWDVNGTPQIAISSSEPGTYLRPGVANSILPGETVVGGVGHAEIKLMNSGLNPFAIGAGRNCCLRMCQPALDKAGITIVTPRQIKK